METDSDTTLTQMAGDIAALKILVGAVVEHLLRQTDDPVGRLDAFSRSLSQFVSGVEIPGQHPDVINDAADRLLTSLEGTLASVRQRLSRPPTAI